MNINTNILFVLLILFLFSCGDDNGFTPPVEDAVRLTEQGWDKFSYRSYENSLLKFEGEI